MEFLNPGSLWLFLLGLIPVVLYLVRRRSKKVRVSTLVFFKTLAREHQESAWLRRLKRWLSFLLTLLVLSLAVLILSRLIVRQDAADQYRTVVILLDRSASMEVKDGEGETRLAVAKRILRERLKQVPEEVGVALVAYDLRPDVLQPRTTKRRELLSRLEAVETRPIEGRPDAALETARMIAGTEPPAVIWHLSDRLLAPAPEDVAVRELSLALPGVVNAGITAVQLRGVPLEHARYDVFVRVGLNRDAPARTKARLDFSVGGIPSQVRELELDPGAEASVTVRVNGSRDQLLRLSLTTDGDGFPVDDEVLLPLPEIRPILAAWIRPDGAEDPYTRLALTSVQESGSFELLKGGPSSWPLSEPVDAVIFDGWLPESWPEKTPVVVINPPDHAAPLAVRRPAAPVPHDSVRTGNEDHPVLFRVSSGRVAVTQTAIYDSRPALEPLWFAGDEPVLSAGEINGNRVVVLGFSPGLSERLPLTASFPILMGNALYWCVAPEQEVARQHTLRTGELAKVSGSSITWTMREGRDLKTRQFPLAGELVEMDRIGSWETDAGVRGSAHLLSIGESDLPALDPEERGDPAYFEVRSGIAGNLKWWLLAAVVALLLLESWLFHRHAVY